MLKRNLLALLLATGTLAHATPQRVVALTPDVAEMMLALDSQALLVGRDQLARHEALQQIPVIGSSRALAAPPILAAKPDLVIGSDQAQPAGIYRQLQQLGLKVQTIRHSESPAGFAQGLNQLAEAVGKPEQGRKLAASWLQAFTAKPASKNSGKRMLFSYDGRLVAGSGTAGDALIRAAGGINAASNIKGFLPMNPEAWLKAAPDIVIVASHNAPVYGSIARLAARPELASSPAAREGKVLAWPAADFLRLGMHSPAVIQRLQQLP